MRSAAAAARRAASVHTEPAVSSAVWMPSARQSLKKASTNSACSKGSPPVQVTPPDLMKFLYFRTSRISSSGVSSYFVFAPISHVSGLWQNLQRMGQPCRKVTKRMPGPSTVPIDSREWMRPIIGESVDVIENCSVMSRWSSAVADRFVFPARRTFGVLCRVLCL